MICKTLYIAAVILTPVIALGSFRGNLNLSYQERSSRSTGGTTSSFSQILNLYATDRIFHDNDLTIGAYIFRSKISTRDQADIRPRYSLNMIGYRYTLYSSLMPYRIPRREDPTRYVRVFQATLSYDPKLLPNLSVSYTSDRQFTKDTPRSVDAFNYSWNVATQTSQSFGSFRGTYQERQLRADLSLPSKLTQQSLNLGYDIGKELPAAVAWSASYSFTGNRYTVLDERRNESGTHTGATRLSREFGKWFSLSTAASGRRASFDRSGGVTTIEDLFANTSGTVNLRHNLMLTFSRTYSSSETAADSTIQVTNDYFNLVGTYRFPSRSGTEGILTFSHATYFESTIGPTAVNNATLAVDMGFYRQTDVTISVGVSHNSQAALGRGRYQISRSVYVTSRPAPKMTASINYQSSLASEKLDLIGDDRDNFSLNMSHLPKPYFHYSVTYSRSASALNGKNVISSLSAAANYRVSRDLSILTTYTRRDLGEAASGEAGRISESLTGQLTWHLTRRSSLTLNYSVANFGTAVQSESLGGYYVVGF